MTLVATAVGNLGKDAEYKVSQDGKGRCTFSVATTSGYGDNKATTWVDVTRFGAGAEGLSKLLTKGTKVTAIGELSTREHNGKTYVQMRADHVILQGGRQGERPVNAAAEYGYSQSQKPAPVTDPLDDDLTDSVPF
jgi:single-strand DNA-binding protein